MVHSFVGKDNTTVLTVGNQWNFSKHLHSSYLSHDLNVTGITAVS